MNTVKIYDTTLRDGSQAEGISFTVEDKIRIAQKLDKLGVHYVEGGWPGSNPRDIEFFSKVNHENFSNTKIAAFGSTRYPEKKVEKRRKESEKVKTCMNNCVFFTTSGLTRTSERAAGAFFG